ncbi:MAG: peptidylprolyl isomerase, partial [Porticoccus sp.]|nr:peptidylprolyl isomerase [Porticoccus sp.]
GQFVPQFEKTMNTIDIDQVSEPFSSQFGWHILQVTERRNQDFTEDIKRSQARNIIKQRKFEEELQIWLQEIRDEAFVEIKS